MRFRILHTFFYPDKSAVSQIIGDLAFHLAEQGHNVEAVATSGHYEGGGRPLPRRQTVRGVSICRVWGPSLGKGSILSRLADLGSYSIGSIAHALTAPRADKVLVLTNPPMYGLVGVLLWYARREPYVHVIMDLYPEAAIQAGLIRPRGIAARVLRRLTRLTLRKARRVVVLGSCMADAVAAYGIDRGKIAIVQNWADGEEIRPVAPGENRLRAELGLADRFVVMYSGNMGVGHRFDDFLEAVARLRDRDDIHFLFVGGGVRRREIEAFRAEHGLENMTLRDRAPRAALSQSLSAGDAHFISLREGFEGLIVPSKLYGVMAAGRATIYQGNPRGEIARVLLEEGGGEVVDEGDTDRIVEIIAAWAADRERAGRIGMRAREIFERNYTKEIALRKYQRILES
jgi:glycosyltransferase involved in cell wall biosynthesis